VADVQGKHRAGGTIQPLVAIFRFPAYGHGSDMSEPAIFARQPMRVLAPPLAGARGGELLEARWGPAI
jgi:hypothetical protein